MTQKANPGPRYIGLGSHEIGGSDEERTRARTLLLHEVHRVCPAVLGDLSAAPFAEFQQYVYTDFGTEATLRAWWNAAHPPDVQTLGAASCEEASWRAVNQRITQWVLGGAQHPHLPALERWAVDHNLDAPWCRIRAASTLYWWLELSLHRPLRPKDFTYWGWMSEGDVYIVPVDYAQLRNVMELPIWVPWEQPSRETATQDIRDDFEKQLTAYLDDVDRLCAQHGMRRKRELREPEAFKLFAQYQCGGREAIDLARERHSTKLAQSARERKACVNQARTALATVSEARETLLAVESRLNAATAASAKTDERALKKAYLVARATLKNCEASSDKLRLAAAVAKEKEEKARVAAVSESSTVRSSIAKIAALVGLHPREARQGRPPSQEIRD